MDIPATSNPGVAEQFMHKNRLQEYAQKSSIPLPLYQTVNEGYPHAPQFRSTVMVDGVTFKSNCTFTHRKEAEQYVAKLALKGLSRKIKDEGVSLLYEDPIFCKSILNEYAVKMSMEIPKYTTTQAEGIIPMFISSSIFDGKTYTGDTGTSKKDAEQMAARSVIVSILANSNTRTLLAQIIKSKRRLFGTLLKGGSSGSLQAADNSSGNVKGKEMQINMTNDNLLGKAGQPVNFVEAPSLPPVKKTEEFYVHKSISGIDMSDSQHVVVDGGRKRSNEDQRKCQFKKIRADGRLPPPPAGASTDA